MLKLEIRRVAGAVAVASALFTINASAAACDAGAPNEAQCRSTQPRQEPQEGVSTEPRRAPRKGVSTEPRQEPQEGVSTEPRQEPQEGVSTEPRQEPQEGVSTEPRQEPQEGVSTEPTESPEEGQSAEPTESPEEGQSVGGIDQVPDVVSVVVPGRVIVPDSSIAAITQASDLNEIAQARLALTRAADPAVLGFAQRMLEHHTGLVAQQSEALAALGIVPLENMVSLMLKSTSALQMAQLMPLSGPEFDLAYMNAQIVDHRMVLQIMDTQLIPLSRDPRLTDLLVNARPMIADHLAEAEAIQARLGAPR